MEDRAFAEALWLLIIVLVLAFALLLAYASARAGWTRAGGPYRLSGGAFMLGASGLLSVVSPLASCALSCP
jgi:hypothetical protein